MYFLLEDATLLSETQRSIYLLASLPSYLPLDLYSAFQILRASLKYKKNPSKCNRVPCLLWTRSKQAQTYLESKSFDLRTNHSYRFSYE